MTRPHETAEWSITESRIERPVDDGTDDVAANSLLILWNPQCGRDERGEKASGCSQTDYCTRDQIFGHIGKRPMLQEAIGLFGRWPPRSRGELLRAHS